jgi:hypothetical protein
MLLPGLQMPGIHVAVMIWVSFLPEAWVRGTFAQRSARELVERSR